MKVKNLFLSLVLSGCTLALSAADKVFIRPVEGGPVDHHGLNINPTPRKVAIDSTRSVAINKGFEFEPAMQCDLQGNGGVVALKHQAGGLPVTGEVIYSNIPAAGYYNLKINPEGVKIRYNDSEGCFYALLTLQQILNSPIAVDGVVPVMEIDDYPVLPMRGIVEGFYGNPWSHATRLSVIDFMGQNKMNSYVYGPKDDPYHRYPSWRQPYPEAEAKKIAGLVEACNRNHIDFVWAIHPGGDIRWDKEDYDSLVAKFNMMYELGVRNFAVFFDDIKGKGTDSYMQAQLLNDLFGDFSADKDDVGQFMVCPTDYSKSRANPDMQEGQLAIYGRNLNPAIDVFWTGDEVCCDITAESLQFVDSRIQRPALCWWNFPVTDYKRECLLQGPVYGLDATLDANNTRGLLSNPMEHGEASKIAFYGVADYAWNPAQYQAVDNWLRALAELAPEAPEAYRTFATHNADPTKWYRRDESWNVETFHYNHYTPEQFNTLKQEFERIASAPSRLRSISNKALLAELEPWLVEFEKLGQRGLNTLQLIKAYESGDTAEFIKAYEANTMSAEETEAYNAHRVGTLKLQPFYKKVMADLLPTYEQAKSKQN